MTEYKCKKHSLKNHDIFINYRVRTDKDLAQKLFFALSSETKSDGVPVRPYLDAECLNDGEDWEIGFLNGLEGAALILLLISEDGISGIKDAHKWQDNVLLEYEYALEKNEKGQALILPLLIGKNVDGGFYKPFSAFSTSVYPDEKHGSDKSTKSVRETMNKLFRLQGIKLNPDAFTDKMSGILRKLEEALSKLGRLGENKTGVSLSFKSKKTGDWTVGDVGAWLDFSGLGEVKAEFAKNAVDGSMLYELSEEELEKDLGVSKKLQRKKLMKFIEKLKAEKLEEEEEEKERKAAKKAEAEAAKAEAAKPTPASPTKTEPAAATPTPAAPTPAAPTSPTPAPAPASPTAEADPFGGGFGGGAFGGGAFGGGMMGVPMMGMPMMGMGMPRMMGLGGLGAPGAPGAPGAAGRGTGRGTGGATDPFGGGFGGGGFGF